MNVDILCCGIFKKELEKLIQDKKLPWTLNSFNSMLHMAPDKLRKVILQKLNPNDRDLTVLVFGDCYTGKPICGIETGKNVVKVSGINCIEIFLGKPEYHKLRKEGAFFLLPEWLKRWKTIFSKELGLDKSNAIIFMQEMHTKIIYLDTGVTPIREDLLRQVKDYTGLNYSILKTDPEILYTTITKAISGSNNDS